MNNFLTSISNFAPPKYSNLFVSKPKTNRPLRDGLEEGTNLPFSSTAERIEWRGGRDARWSEVGGEFFRTS